MNNFKKILSDNLGIIILFLLGLLLRACCLGSKSLWYDEALVLLEAQKTLAALFQVNTEGIHPPLYRLIMHFWLYLGQSEELVRIPSVIFSAFSIIVGYKTVKLIFNKRVALYTAFFITVSPFHIYYAQEVKSYSLFFLLSLVSLYFFIKIIKENKIGLWLGYILFTTLSVYTHYFGFINIFAQNLFMIFSYKKYSKDLFKKWIIAQSVIFLLFIPWMFVCIEHLRRVTNNFWIPPVSVEDIFHIFGNFTLGYYTLNLNFIFPGLLIAGLFFCGIWAMVSFSLTDESSPGWNPKERLLISLSYLFIPVIILVFSKVIRPIYLDRTLITVSFFYYIILSKGIEFFHKNKVILALVIFSSVILITISLKNYYYGNSFRSSIGVVSIKKQFKEAMKYIILKYHKGDIIVLSHHSFWPSLEYYCSPDLKNKLYLDNSFGDDIDENDRYSAVCLKESLDYQTIDIEGLKKDENSGIWIICSHWGDSPFVSQKLKKWMDMHADDLILKIEEFRGMQVYYFK